MQTAGLVAAITRWIESWERQGSWCRGVDACGCKWMGPPFVALETQRSRSVTARMGCS